MAKQLSDPDRKYYLGLAQELLDADVEFAKGFQTEFMRNIEEKCIPNDWCSPRQGEIIEELYDKLIGLAPTTGPAKCAETHEVELTIKFQLPKTWDSRASALTFKQKLDLCPLPPFWKVLEVRTGA